MKGVAVLGSTGSIGVSTLDVLARHPDRYRVVALTANTGVDKLFEQCLQAAEFFHGYVFPGNGFDDFGTGDKHITGIFNHKYPVGQRRGIDGPSC